DLSLGQQVAHARKLVSLGRAARSQAGVRVRQPLAVLRVATPDGANGSTAPALTALRPELAADVRDELNVKRIEIVPDLAEVVDGAVRPGPDRLGPRLGRDFPRVLDALRAGEFTLHGDGSVEAGGQRLAPDEVQVSLTPRPGYAAAEAEGVTVAL